VLQVGDGEHPVDEPTEQRNHRASGVVTVQENVEHLLPLPGDLFEGGRRPPEVEPEGVLREGEKQRVELALRHQATKEGNSGHHEYVRELVHGLGIGAQVVAEPLDRQPTGFFADAASRVRRAGRGRAVEAVPRVQVCAQCPADLLRIGLPAPATGPWQVDRHVPVVEVAEDRRESGGIHGPIDLGDRYPLDVPAVPAAIDDKRLAVAAVGDQDAMRIVVSVVEGRPRPRAEVHPDDDLATVRDHRPDVFPRRAAGVVTGDPLLDPVPGANGRPSRARVRREALHRPQRRSGCVTVAPVIAENPGVELVLPQQATVGAAAAIEVATGEPFVELAEQGRPFGHRASLLRPVCGQTNLLIMSRSEDLISATLRTGRCVIDKIVTSPDAGAHHHWCPYHDGRP
jgi:hypothetical protein